MSRFKKGKKKNSGMPKLSSKKEKALRKSSKKINTLCQRIDRVPVTLSVKIGKELLKDEEIMFGNGEPKWGTGGLIERNFSRILPRRGFSAT